MTTVLDEEWDVVFGLLPPAWRELAKTTGAMRRARGAITSADTLLRLMLMHLAGGLSLRQTAARAAVQGLVDVSDVALWKRLQACEAWFTELCVRMTADRSAAVVSPAGRRLRAIDATTVEEPGASGTSYRVHYSLTLPDLKCDFFELTDVKGGEKLGRFTFAAEDIVLADRGYSHREGVAHLLRSNADVVVRYNQGAFPLCDANGKPYRGLLSWLRAIKGHACAQMSVCFEFDDVRWPVRICAIRKSKAAADAAKRKLTKAASKKGKTLGRDTLEFAEYVVVITSLPAAEWSASRVMQLYRARWQIELHFKRLKSLLKLGCLPKKKDGAARAWIQGKLLLALMIERLVDRARSFSPWGYEVVQEGSMAPVH